MNEQANEQPMQPMGPEQLPQPVGQQQPAPQQQAPQLTAEQYLAQQQAQIDNLAAQLHAILQQQQQQQHAAQQQQAALFGSAILTNPPTPTPRPKLPKPPETNGRVPTAVNWSYKMTTFLEAEGFDLENTPAAVTYAAAFLKDAALKWHRQHVINVQAGRKADYRGWTEFKDAFIKRFTPVDPEVTARERLDRCVQKASAYQYASDFDALTLELPHMDEADKLHRFIQGLKSNLRLHIKLQRPKTLLEAQDLAIRADNSMWTDRGDRGRRGTAAPTHLAARNGPTPMEMDNMEDADNHGRFNALRDSGNNKTGDAACWFCGKPGHFKRECRKYKAALASGQIKAGRPSSERGRRDA